MITKKCNKPETVKEPKQVFKWNYVKDHEGIYDIVGYLNWYVVVFKPAFASTSNSVLIVDSTRNNNNIESITNNDNYNYDTHNFTKSDKSLIFDIV